MPSNDTGIDAVFERIAALPTAALAGCLAGQAPQMVAALLLRVSPAVAAAVLAGVPADLRHRVLRRMAVTGPASPALIARIVTALESELADPPLAKGTEPAGRLADILAALPPEAAGDGPPSQPPPAPVPPATEPPALSLQTAFPGLSPGLAALLNTPVVIRDRMPMLEVMLDRHVRILSSRLRTLCGDVEAGLLRLSSIRFGDWLNGSAGSAAIGHPQVAVVRSHGWDHYALLLVDEDARETIVEAALGGGADAAADRIAGRVPTKLDHCALTLIADAFLETLNTAFSPIGTPDFQLDRIEDNPRFATIDRPCNACLLAEFDIHRSGAGGRIGLLLPYALLEPVRDRLTRAFTGERFGQDARWATHLRDRLAHARVRVAAVAGGAEVTLGAALAWRPGGVVRLDSLAGSDVILVAGGAEVGLARLTQRGGRYTAVPHPIPDLKGNAMTADTNATDAGIRTVEPPAEPGGDQPPPSGLSALHHVKLRLSAVVGSADMTVEDLLQLGRGAVVELNRRVGEAIDITVNDQIIAKGELVVIEDRLAVSLLEIVGAPG